MWKLNKQEVLLIVTGGLETTFTWAIYLAVRYGTSPGLLIHGLIVGALLYAPFFLYHISRERLAEYKFGYVVGILSFLFPFILVACDSYLLPLIRHTPFQARDLWTDMIVVYLLTYVMLYASFVYRMQGPKGMWRFYLRKYAKPVYEDKVIMFLDINDSTTIAERIGHKKFLSFLNDFFSLISDEVVNYDGEIHKYVGDEIILFWEYDKVRSNEPIECFRAAVKAIERKKALFRRRYGLEEVGFKAGLHAGPVVVGELGKYKRELAFTGDTMNVAARLEELSKQKGCRLVVTADYLNLVRDVIGEQTYRHIGKIALRGKHEQLDLYCAL